MKIEINGADLILVGMFVYAAYAMNFFWFLGIVPLVIGWFGHVVIENRSIRWRWK